MGPRTAWTSLLIGLLCWATPAVGRACACGRALREGIPQPAAPVKISLDHEAAVFTGVVDRFVDEGDVHRWQFVVDRRWKGPRSREVWVRTASPEVSSCGMSFELGARYLVVSESLVKSEPQVFPCSYTSKADTPEARDVLAGLGPGWAPEVGTPPGCAVAPSAGGVLWLLVLGVRRRRRPVLLAGPPASLRKDPRHPL